jgi:hypothetical protein
VESRAPAGSRPYVTSATWRVMNGAQLTLCLVTLAVHRSLFDYRARRDTAVPYVALAVLITAPYLLAQWHRNASQTLTGPAITAAWSALLLGALLVWIIPGPSASAKAGVTHAHQSVAAGEPTAVVLLALNVIVLSCAIAAGWSAAWPRRGRAFEVDGALLITVGAMMAALAQFERSGWIASVQRGGFDPAVAAHQLRTTYACLIRHRNYDPLKSFPPNLGSLLIDESCTTRSEADGTNFTLEYRPTDRDMYGRYASFELRVLERTSVLHPRVLWIGMDGTLHEGLLPGPAPPR